MDHELKTWPHSYQLVANNDKPFEIRRNDRDYRTGDTLHLREWDPDLHEYTGRSLRRAVTVVVLNVQGLRPGYCVIGLTTLPEDSKTKEGKATSST